MTDITRYIDITSSASSSSSSGGSSGSSTDMPTNESLTAWALSGAFRLVDVQREANGTLVSASIFWPDGVGGTLTGNDPSTTFPGAIDGWTATYAGAQSVTLTQPMVSRDSAGNIISQPAIVIA